MSAIAMIEAYQAADGSLHRKVDSLVEADARLALSRWCKAHGIGDAEATPIIEMMKSFGHELHAAFHALEVCRRPGATEVMKREAAGDLRQLCLKLGIGEQPEKTYANPSGHAA